MGKLKMIEFDEAQTFLAQWANEAGSLPAGTSLPLEQGQGHYLAESILATMDSPAFDVSAMDGIAFGTESASSLRLIGTLAAGERADAFRVGVGECLRIMTGAPLPPGADRVEMIEKVRIEGEWVHFADAPARGQHVRLRGENVRCGESLFQAGQFLTAGVVAALAAQGIRRIRPRRALRIGIATTGDELCDYRRPLGEAQIYDSNSHVLAGLFRGAAFEVQRLGQCPDRVETLAAFLRHQLDFDLLLLSGGVSMGSFDFVPEAASRAGFEEGLHKVKIKPGKPVWVGRSKEGTLLFGLPGNPVSAQLTASLFAMPFALARLSGVYRAPKTFLCPITAALSNPTGLTHFVPALWSGEGGQLAVEPLVTSGSGDLTRFSRAQALLRLPPHFKAGIGDPVQVLLPLSELFG